jgi:hypothetical protein
MAGSAVYGHHEMERQPYNVILNRRGSKRGQCIARILADHVILSRLGTSANASTKEVFNAQVSRRNSD